MLRGCRGEATLPGRFHFISGLPRSGSTLLGAILSQNPRFHASMSSPVAGVIGTLLEELSARNEFSVFFDDAARKRVLRGVFESFYADCDKAVIFDTNRAWCARMPALADLFPESRVIACVRELPWIIDSLERVIAENAFSPSSIFGFKAGGTVYTRASAVAGSDGMVGYAYDAVKQAFYGEQADRLLLVQYETLTSDPARTLKAIYDFIGEPGFTHDFGRVAFDDRGFDARAGTPGLHRVRPRVAASTRASILPPDLFKRFENDAFWRNPQLNTRNVRIV